MGPLYFSASSKLHAKVQIIRQFTKIGYFFEFQAFHIGFTAIFECMLNKLKIINDPVYGFIKIRYEILYHLIEHPYFQRLRRIRQLGMSHFVYPGANHTRFQHALGAMHLMNEAIESIRGKGHQVTDQEAEAVTIAILLHDIGHGPFSHTLERTLISGFSHESISLKMMEMLNLEFDGRLSMAIEIFTNTYPKRFLHQLVSSQLDMDRLDYLKRDSFFTGVTEGSVGSDRIIKMLEVHNDELVVEEKGVYSIEKFLVSRRHMYWQVYLHKGVIAADQQLIMMLERAKFLVKQGMSLFSSPALSFFLHRSVQHSENDLTPEFLEQFAELDDNDIISAAKVWSKVDDPVLRYLCSGFVNRKLFRIEIRDEPVTPERLEELLTEVSQRLKLSREESRFLVVSESISNHAYSTEDDSIKVLGKQGDVKDIIRISDILSVQVLSQQRRKYFLCYPKNL